jgi:hypothetical protein
MAGRGRGWGADVTHCSGNDLHHTLDIPQHVVVPEPEHAIAAGFEVCGSPRVTCKSGRFIVLAAIKLDDETRRVTGEVSEVWADRRLTAEVGARNPQTAQVLPKHTLCVGWLMTHLARAGNARVTLSLGLSLPQDPPPPTPPRRFAAGGKLRRCLPDSER